MDGEPLTSKTFADLWLQVGGVSALLACAERTGIRIGIWGGCVRNFLLDNRSISDELDSIHLIDFIDPFSDIDCVLDHAGDWPSVIQALSASVAFSGYVRWEFQTREDAITRANDYARIGAESFVVWHEGFESERRPKLTFEAMGGAEVDALLRAPSSRISSITKRKGITDDPWQDLFNALRMTRYRLQYPESHEEVTTSDSEFPDLRRMRDLGASLKPPGKRSHNLLRFELALLDLIFSAYKVQEALGYLKNLSERLPSPIRERSSILNAIEKHWKPSASFLEALVYRQPNKRGLQMQVRTRDDEKLSRGGFRSIVPWISMWSVGSGGEECCRYEDFKNGFAIASWRALNPNVRYSQTQARESAPVAQITRSTAYGQLPKMAGGVVEGLFSIPGIVRVGAGMTLRFDHAYLSHLFGRKVQASIGVVNPEKLG